MVFKYGIKARTQLLKKLKILKIRDLLTFINCEFMQAHMTEKLSQNFSEYFKEMRNQDNFNTRESKEGMIFKITQRTTTYGLNSIHRKAANDWNELLKNS